MAVLTFEGRKYKLLHKRGMFCIQLQKMIIQTDPLTQMCELNVLLATKLTSWLPVNLNDSLLNEMMYNTENKMQGESKR